MISRAEYERLQLQARQEVRKQVKAGKLPRPQDCECVLCGKPASGYDHRNYLKPLEVRPLCKSCNGKEPPALPEFVKERNFHNATRADGGDGDDYSLTEFPVCVDFDSEVGVEHGWFGITHPDHGLESYHRLIRLGEMKPANNVSPMYTRHVDSLVVFHDRKTHEVISVSPMHPKRKEQRA